MIVQACKYVATCQSLDVFRMLFIQICYFFVCVPCAAPAFYCAWNFLLFYLMLLFSKLSGAAEVAQYTLQLRFHILYTYTQSLFFLLLSGVCKHSSFIHSSLWALFLFSRRQMLLCYIDCVNFHHHLWCLTNVIMHYSLSSQCIWSNKFCLWGIFFFIQWRDGGGERAVFQHVLVIWAHAKHWHHVSIFRVVALTWFSHSELCLTSNINTW